MKIKRIAEKEFEDNKFLLSQLENPYIKQRAESCLKWYIENAVKNKYYFYILSTFTIVCPLISTIILCASAESFCIKIASTTATAISAIAAALLNLLDAKRKWELYRSQAEILKTELTLQDCEETKRSDREFLETMEDSMKKTHEYWVEPFKRVHYREDPGR